MRNSSSLSLFSAAACERRTAVHAGLLVIAMWSMAANTEACDWGALIRLDRAEMRAHLIHFESLQPPCCSRGLNLTGSVEMRIAFDTRGYVVCAEAVKGQPIALHSAMQSAKNWKFRPFESGGKARRAYGEVVVHYRLADQGSTSSVE